MKKLSIIEVKKRAKILGVDLPKTAKKSEWIVAIQKAEGNRPCFGIEPSSCGQQLCCWRPDCEETVKV